MRNLKETLKLAEKLGWKVEKHIRFADGQHNYILTDKENSCYVVYWCEGNQIFDSMFNDFKYIS